MPEPTSITPGLLVLHGNRLETLADTVLAWLARHPLAPLEEEVLLVPSNGMAEWLKMAAAGALGVCAAVRVELPARFLWRAYRTVLGRSAVPALSPLDKLPLTWRLMALLPQLAGDAAFAPLAGYLHGAVDDDGTRQLQLAQRLADLFDQYQVHRADWLQDWAAGRDTLGPQPLPAEQAWQPALWRALRAGLPAEQREAARATLQQRFLQALQGAGPFPALPRRIVLFGSTHVPQPVLQALEALSRHSQVLMAVPNPCRFHWADTVAGSELFNTPRRRAPLRAGRELATLPPEALHAHGHPLLAAWGRQARDFVRLLDAFDDAQAARERFALPRLDLFDEGPGASLLQQLQARIRDLVPNHEPPAAPVADDDRSIVFHIAHSAQREVEILHDQLLQLLAQPPGGRPLAPREIVVMVPDIERFAPAIRSVFGQHPRGHARHIPWGLADQRQRGHGPLLLALEWLLRAPQQRFAFGELRALLETPAAARRLGLGEDDSATLLAWMAEAGIRWGLHAEQRAALDLAACGEANSAAFGLSRMLLGYATGELDDGFAGTEPLAEVAGLQAALAGTLALLLERLGAWWQDAARSRSPAAWAQRLRQLLADFFEADDDNERQTLAALDDALGAWLDACDHAGFSDALPLAVLREAWLQALDEPQPASRFRAGGVTFCTLLPMRAIPFEVVCLLGMNDGDYPRRSPRSDFDLMALPGQARPGDRSRRDDDRQLMLDALLSARRVLYLSWAGRSVRDGQPQPPSVLVGQLRDHLAAVWGGAALLRRLDTEHPLQPFSRRYFEPGSGLFSHAIEWREAHAVPEAWTATTPALAAEPVPWTLDRLAAFVRNPVQAWFRHRLRVQFDEQDAVAPDDEPFEGAGLEAWQWQDEVLRRARSAEGPAAALVAQGIARLQRAGRLPLAGPGAQQAQALQQALLPSLAEWQAQRAALGAEQPPLALAFTVPGQPTLRLDDGLGGLRGSAPLTLLELRAGRLASGQGKNAAPRPDKLLPAWLRLLAAAASGTPVGLLLVGGDAVLQAAPVAPAAAAAQLADLLRAAQQGLQASEPWPTALKTGCAWLASPEKARAAYEGSEQVLGEGREACLARLFPDWASLCGAPGFEAATQALYAAFREWLTTQVSVSPLPEAAALEEADD
jgi:exodeoxyribonuclease V gamma subunit